MNDTIPINVILAQIKNAKTELEAYAPDKCDWYKRCSETAKLLVPWLTEHAADLQAFVQEVLNSRSIVRASWEQIKTEVESRIPAHLLATMDRELDREAILIEYIAGATTSKIIEKYLIENFETGELESNGRSDYPDLFLRSRSYNGLPRFKKLKGKTKKYGAALKGKGERPVRVPDGLEIKTCRERFAVDCHHAHAGLHLVLLFQESGGSVKVEDILVAFMSSDDYRITKPATPTTTLKASFNGDKFVSLITS